MRPRDVGTGLDAIGTGKRSVALEQHVPYYRCGEEDARRQAHGVRSVKGSMWDGNVGDTQRISGGDSLHEQAPAGGG